MKVKLYFNIPADSAARLALAERHAGAIVDVEPVVADELIGNHWGRLATVADVEAAAAARPDPGAVPTAAAPEPATFHRNPHDPTTGQRG